MPAYCAGCLRAIAERAVSWRSGSWGHDSRRSRAAFGEGALARLGPWGPHFHASSPVCPNDTTPSRLIKESNGSHTRAQEQEILNVLNWPRSCCLRLGQCRPVGSQAVYAKTLCKPACRSRAMAEALRHQSAQLSRWWPRVDCLRRLEYVANTCGGPCAES